MGRRVCGVAVKAERPQAKPRTNGLCDTRSHSASERIGLEGRLMPKV